MLFNKRTVLPFSTSVISAVMLVCLPFKVALADSPSSFTLFVSFPPAVCAIDPSKQKLRQCQEGFRMIVTGLRPESRDGRPPPPERCRHADDDPELPPLQSSVLDKVMPDKSMRLQDWHRHGACSGMSPPDYFRTISNLSSKLRTPREFNDAKESVFSQDQLINQLVKLNVGLLPQSMAFKCASSAQYSRPVLTEIRVCYDNQANYGICPPHVRSNCPSEFSVVGTP